MVFRVLIISLMVFTTVAEAARPKCERILVSDDFIETVNAVGRDIAELSGEFKLKMSLRGSPESKIHFVASDEDLVQIENWIVELKSGLEGVRSLYTKSVEASQEAFQKLVVRLDDIKPLIKNGLTLSTAKPVARDPGPKRFMKREVLDRFPELEGATDEEIKNFLRESEQPVNTPVKPPTFLPGSNPMEWPPRLKP